MHVCVSSWEELTGGIRDIELHRQRSRAGIDGIGGSRNRSREMAVWQFGQVHGCFCTGPDLLAEFFRHGDEYTHDVVLRNMEQLTAYASIARIHEIAEIRFP